MSLTEKISADLITAMKAKDKVALEAIRAAKTAFTLARAEKGADTLTSEEELKIMQKLVKQRRESAAIYREQNRPDLYEKEETEADVLEKYLPAKMSEEELVSIIKGIIEPCRSKICCRYGQGNGSGNKGACRKSRRERDFSSGKEAARVMKYLAQSR